MLAQFQKCIGEALVLQCDACTPVAVIHRCPRYLPSTVSRLFKLFASCYTVYPRPFLRLRSGWGYRLLPAASRGEALFFPVHAARNPERRTPNGKMNPLELEGSIQWESLSSHTSHIPPRFHAPFNVRRINWMLNYLKVRLARNLLHHTTIITFSARHASNCEWNVKSLQFLIVTYLDFLFLFQFSKICAMYATFRFVQTA